MLGAGTILRAVGKTQYSLAAYAVSALVGLPTTYYLVRSYGIHGAIWGAVINICLPRFIQMFIEARQADATITNYLDWKSIGYVFGWGLLLLIPLIAIKLLAHPSVWICIILSGIYVVLAYLLYVKKDVFLLPQETVYRFFSKLKR